MSDNKGSEVVVVEDNEELAQFISNLGKVTSQGFADVARAFSIADIDKVDVISKTMSGVSMVRVSWWLAGCFLSWAEGAPAHVRKGVAAILRRLATEVESGNGN